MHEPAAPWVLPQVDEQLYQLQHERADLLKRIDEDQEDLNELMAKHKALIAQVGAGAAEAGQHPPTREGAWKTCSLAESKRLSAQSPPVHSSSETPGSRCCDGRKEWLTAPSPLTRSFESSFKRCLGFSFSSWEIL